MHLLQSGLDLAAIALWLGHESPLTTHQYLEADLEMKKKILSHLASPKIKPVVFRPKDELLARNPKECLLALRESDWFIAASSKAQAPKLVKGPTDQRSPHRQPGP